MRNVCIIMAAAFLLFPTIVSAQTEAQAKGKQELEQYFEGWNAFMKNGDLDKLKEIYPEDHSSMAINNGIIREQNYSTLHASYKSQFANATYSGFEFTEGPYIHVSKDGSMGYVVGSIRMTSKSKDGGYPATFKGTGIDVMEKRDGKWVEVMTSWKYQGERKSIAVDKSALEDYVGAYELKEQGATFHAEIGEDGLQLRGPGQTLPCIQDTEFTFHLSDDSAEMVFIRDKTGTVTHLVFATPYMNLVLPRVEK